MNFAIAKYQNLDLHITLLFLCGIHFYFGVLFQLLARVISIPQLLVFCVSIFIFGFVQNIQTFQSIGLTGIIFVADLIFRRKRLRLNKNLYLLGNISYASFLFHIPLQIAFIFVADSSSISDNIYKSEWFFLMYFITVQVSSVLIYRYIQRPITQKFQGRSQKA